MLNIVKYTGQYSATKNSVIPNISNAKLETPCSEHHSAHKDPWRFLSLVFSSVYFSPSVFYWKVRNPFFLLTINSSEGLVSTNPHHFILCLLNTNQVCFRYSKWISFIWLKLFLIINSCKGVSEFPEPDVVLDKIHPFERFLIKTLSSAASLPSC